MTELIKDYVTLREHLPPIRLDKQQSVGFVPTMGALHDGHLTLVEQCKKQCETTVVSIFVNPMQFAEGEDLDKYPRQLEDDMAKLKAANVDILYAPTVQEIYPQGFQTIVSVEEISQGLCGASRIGHFNGVCTVVAKLLLHVIPDKVYFGEKDYQQLKVIERMVHDLSIPTDVIPVPTIREKDGLALSSRNAYLSESDRQTAPTLYAQLNEAAAKLKSGASTEEVLAETRKAIEAAGFTVDYLEYRSGDDLQPLSSYQPRSRLFVAAYLGTTRLIDNIAVETS